VSDRRWSAADCRPRHHPARRRSDAARVADLTRRAFAAQAALYEDDTLPPLADTAESVAAEMARGVTVLVAEMDCTIVGSVRGELRDGICHIGRLVVEPGLQGRGLGRRLATELEACSRRRNATRYSPGTAAKPLSLSTSPSATSRQRVVPVHERLSLVFLGKDARE
jgi:GNAT superfamily N-acetyltransferase